MFDRIAEWVTGVIELLGYPGLTALVALVARLEGPLRLVVAGAVAAVLVRWWRQGRPGATRT